LSKTSALIGWASKTLTLGDDLFPHLFHRQIITPDLYNLMPWVVINHEEFDAEFDALPYAVRVELLAATGLLEIYGPTLGRPHADTLTGSKHANMKKLRFNADNGVWRVAFAFDPARQAIILVAGEKSGVAQKRFYKALIAKADSRFSEHLKTSKEA
jgi:hypothetical protein